MIAAPLVSAMMIVSVALGLALDPGPTTLSDAQKRAAVRPLVARATECIASNVLAQPSLSSPGRSTDCPGNSEMHRADQGHGLWIRPLFW